MMVKRSGRRVLLAALCMASAAAQGAAPEVVDSKWTPVGWGGGGFYFSAAFSPTDDGVIYLGGDVNGAYKSEDHGDSWHMINNGIASYAAYSLAVAPATPGTVFVGTEGGLCKSTDAGGHWQLLPRTGTKELHITAERNKSIRAIAVDPTNSDIVYAGTPLGKIYKSTDGGQNWAAVYEPKSPDPAPPHPHPRTGNAHSDKPHDGTIYSVAVSPSEPATVFACTADAGLLISEDSGQSWRPLDTPKRAASVAIAANDPKVIYATFFSDGIRKSSDKGHTWTDISAGLEAGASMKEIVVSPQNANDVYVIGAKGWNGLFYASHDGGATWMRSNQIHPDREADPTLPEETANGKTTALSTPTNLSINPKNPKQLFISANWRSCISNDAGATWTESMRGADITCVFDIRFKGNRTYVAAMDEGVLMSDDNGNQWQALWPLRHTDGLSGHYWRLAITDNGGADRILSTSSPWETKFNNQVVLSEDGGKTFAAQKQGLPDYLPTRNTMWGRAYARALAADPKNPDVVYLGIDGDADEGKTGGGIFKSKDGGKTWAQLPNQPPSRRMFFGLAVDPTDSNRLYWGACGDSGGLYRSDDAGASWKLVFKNDRWIFNVLVTADGTIYCPGKQLWRSTDHGQTWKALTSFKTDGAIVGLEVRPDDPKTIWLAMTTWHSGADGGVYKTIDGGETWQDITGDLPYRKPLILRFNPATSELWAGGVGLYRIKQ